MFNKKPLTLRILLTGFFLMSGYLGTLHGQSTEYILKAGFIERFTRFIEWPSDSLQADTTKPFIILVLGKNPFGDNLQKFFTKTRIKGRKVVIRYAAKLDTNKYYHMIFICDNMSSELNFILNYAHDKPLITIGETEGFGSRGVLINFFLDNNKIRFEINQAAFRNTGLKVSHMLLNSAKIIN